MTTGGIVLCGGRSSRMGRPKEWLPFAGEPLLQRVVRVVAGAVSPVVVVAAPGQDVPTPPPGIRLLRDAVEGRGPLSGLATGLAGLEGRVDAAFVTGCDTPYLVPGFIQQLVRLRGDAAACVAVTDGRPRPLPGVFAVGVVPVVQELLATEQFRLGALLERVSTRLVQPHELAPADPGLRSLWNVNTPEEYAAALAALGPH